LPTADFFTVPGTVKRKDMPRAVILSAARTPVGRYGGALSHVRPDDLAAVVIRAAIERAGVPPGDIEDVWFGCAN
jgi:acetyl-CoA acetyltransferase